MLSKTYEKKNREFYTLKIFVQKFTMNIYNNTLKKTFFNNLIHSSDFCFSHQTTTVMTSVMHLLVDNYNEVLDSTKGKSSICLGRKVKFFAPLIF